MKFIPEVERHIQTLADHGVTVFGGSEENIPLSVEFCEADYDRILADPAVVSFVYDIRLPGIDGEFQIMINRDGTVDSGSKESINQIIQARR